MGLSATGRAAGVCGLVLAAILAIGFALQAALLPRPTRSELIASQALDRLLSYRVVQGREVLAGRQINSVCWQTTVASGPKHLPEPAEVVRLGTQTIVDLGFQLHGPGKPKLRLAAFELAGCPQPIAAWIGGWLTRWRPVRVTDASFHRVPALELQVGKPWRHLAFIVARASLVPLALQVAIDGINGSSRITFVGTKPPSAEALEALGGQRG
ncbi:MAG: hypothetical protein WBB76_12220 [Gaiellaceae bacterium]